MNPNERLTSENWQRVGDILLAALELEDRDARERLVREQSAGDSALYKEVMSLLAADTSITPVDSFRLSEHVANPSLADEAPTRHNWIGERLGAYQITERIADGGMGSVYKAIRADDAYQTVVAIKLMRDDLGATPAARVLSRFRAERQMLASLNHPNITRLIDAGSTNEGRPYFVMEYVDGEPIDHYCETHGLTIADRLQKFRDVCSAVHFAHQRLIVHRDLKPNNILIDKSGVVKLLDFGIARLCDPSDARLLDRVAEAANDAGANQSAATTMLALTPSYASPEQVKNEAITTASDVYSLGVVLYRMLTNRSPYKATPKQSLELAREIVETDPERPSTAITRPDVTQQRDTPIANDKVVSGKRVDIARLRKELQGDLDNIVLMALRKEPGQRYASVEQLSQDVQRHLDGQPVLAHADSLAYRAKKFAQRNRWSVGFASLAATGLVAGIIATTYQAKLAREAQAQAEAQKSRAEKHFASVRKIASGLIFEVNRDIADLPGAAPVQKKLIANALTYLNELQKEADNDPELLYEISGGYRRLALAQGGVAVANTGDVNGAEESFSRAVALVEAAFRLKPRDSKIGIGYLRLLNNFSEQQGRLNKLDSARALFAQGGKVAEELGKNHPDNVDVLLAIFSFRVAHEVAVYYIKIGVHDEKRISALASELESFLSRPRERDDAIAARGYLYRTNVIRADIERRLEDGTSKERALVHIKQNVELVRANLREGRDAPGYRKDLANALRALASEYNDVNDARSAIGAIAEARALHESLVANDPQNAEMLTALLQTYADESLFLEAAGEPLGAIDALEKSKAIYARLSDSTRKYFDVRQSLLKTNMASAKINASFALESTRNIAERRKLCADAAAALKQAKESAASDPNLVFGDVFSPAERSVQRCQQRSR
jgi:serine/threonine protein kinase